MPIGSLVTVFHQLGPVCENGVEMAWRFPFSQDAATVPPQPNQRTPHLLSVRFGHETTHPEYWIFRLKKEVGVGSIHGSAGKAPQWSVSF
jgi:hypothetical protein